MFCIQDVGDSCFKKFFFTFVVTKYFKSKFKSYRYVKFKNVLHKAFYTLTILNCNSEIK